jgi:RNAse (barnase) inhibitor barstar
MHRIRIDTTNCRDATGFYTELLQALGAPSWHGHNMDAIWDSLVGGGVIGVGPPLLIEIDLQSDVPTEVRHLADRLSALCLEARATQGMDVAVRIHPAPGSTARGSA